MYDQVQSATMKNIQYVQYIVYSCDEVTTMDNCSWICVHAYVVSGWTKVPILVFKGWLMDQALTT